ncbi:semaphorin-5A-like isoform X2 [Dreissena polymorpha]|uniref:semaphorin-5A-like isoform X2 n=1 Tax=Dreissena polymorpha TaxID=45954 RepID=UPI00226563C9|nr:semaphorin-5A-like isoform X2 [Dreissena polymorpha]
MFANKYYFCNDCLNILAVVWAILGPINASYSTKNEENIIIKAGTQRRFLIDGKSPSSTQWSSWEQDAACQTTCVPGYEDATRACCLLADNQRCLSLPWETLRPRIGSCSIDGNWSEWSEWTPCTVTCGGGTSLRTRQCIYPVEFMHGSSCNGSSAVAKTCEMQQCAHAEAVGNWQPWEQWSSCDATCGLATRTRQRSCNDSASYMAPCPGHDMMNETCGFTHCPEAYSWLPWEQWSSCSSTCGEAARTRQRSCNDTSSYPSPCNGTSLYPSPCNDTSLYPSPCTGQDIMNETCNLAKCSENATSMCKAQITTGNVWIFCDNSAFLVTDPEKVFRSISSEKCIFKGAELPEFNRMSDQQIKDKLDGCQFTSQMIPSELYLIKNSGSEACRYIQNSMGKINVVKETDMSRCPLQSFLICERTHHKSSEFDQWFATKNSRNILRITSATGNYSQCHTICSSVTGRKNATLASLRVVLSFPDTLPPPDTGFTSLWVDHSGVANSSCSIIQYQGDNRMHVLGNSDCSQAGHCVCDANAAVNCS